MHAYFVRFPQTRFFCPSAKRRPSEPRTKSWSFILADRWFWRW